jgi:hypothetical protein
MSHLSTEGVFLKGPKTQFKGESHDTSRIFEGA